MSRCHIHGKPSHTITVNFHEKIRSSLKNAGKEKGDWDALQYASLATLAFRVANIPARYVEGYEAVTSDEKDANGNFYACRL